MNIPSDLQYSTDHEWIRRDGNIVTIGITEFAQDSLGDVVFVEVPEDRQRMVEPGLPSALAGLSENQRIAVTLLYGHQWTMSEVADLLGVTKSTVQVHADRGLLALQSRLGVKA